MTNEEKLKIYYYFPFRSDFFQQEAQKDIKTIAEENGDNPNDYLTFWLKLIVASLPTRGLISKSNHDQLCEGALKNLLGFETAATAKETINLISRIVIALEEKKLIYFSKNRTAIKIPIVSELTMNKEEESEHIKLIRLKQAALNKEFDAIINNQKLDPESEFEIYFSKTFAGLVYYNYAKEQEKETYKLTLQMLFKDLKNKNLELATEDFLRNKIPILNLAKIIDKISYMEATLKAFIKDKQAIYESTRITRQKLTTSEVTQEVIEIANYDWIHQ